MEFEHDPKSVATDTDDVSSHKPIPFISSALQQSTVSVSDSLLLYDRVWDVVSRCVHSDATALLHVQVGCTWDEDDTRRMQVTRRKIKEDELDQLNLDDYLASGSESEADGTCAYTA